MKRHFRDWSAIHVAMQTASSPTIVDVARLAGVSTATVSRVVNGSTKVAADTVKVVTLAVRACQYEPNRDAIRLRSLRRDNGPLGQE